MHSNRHINPEDDTKGPDGEPKFVESISPELFVRATEQELRDRCNIYLRKAAFYIGFETKGGSILGTIGTPPEEQVLPRPGFVSY